MQKVLSFEAALAEVLEHARSLAGAPKVQTVPLLEAAGRVLAHPLSAERDQPPFDRSTRDGFAVRSSDLTAEGSSLSGGSKELRVTGSVRAGELWSGRPLAPGEAIEIMTGAPLPEGADAVVMLEHVRRTSDSRAIHPERRLRAGENVVRRGAEARAGDTLLPAGRVLQAAEIAVAASCGCGQMEVSARPEAAIIATGDELIELDQQPEPSQIRNSNSYALAALVHREGGVARQMPIARDTVSDLRERVAEARGADLLLLSGGVSMGQFDLVEEVLEDLGAAFFFTGALIQPGKPVVFGRLPKEANDPAPETSNTQGRWTYFFGLPGNPISTQVCFHLFVAPLLRALGGRTDIAPPFVEARLAKDVKGGAGVTRFLPAELVGTPDAVRVRVVSWQGSGDVAANARGNCYCMLPAGVEMFRSGETVRVLLR